MRPAGRSRDTATDWMPRPTWICRIRSRCRPMCSCSSTKPESAAHPACCCVSIANSAWCTVHEANPCRCARKTQGFMKAGFVDPQKLLFARAHVTRVRDVAEKKCEELDALDQA